MSVRALSIHADYRCHSTGVCCGSGWDIPVEPVAEARIREGLACGRLRADAEWARPVPGLPHGARVLLRVLPSGDCVFLEPGGRRLCAVHRQLGEDALPPSCRQFPRLVTLIPGGVSVTLSHYCPTAAGLLFRDDIPLGVVSDPPAFPASWPFEGLDAREALPPLLRPGVLMSWAAHLRLEEHAVSLFAREGLSVELVLATLAAQAEALRSWTVAAGDFDEFVEHVLAASERPPEPGPMPLEASLADWDRVAAVVPAAHPRPPSPRAALEAFGLPRAQSLVDDAGPALRRPVGRWLAAKAFASWLALQGEGVRTSGLGLRVAHSLLRVEAARAVVEADAAVDAERLKQAIRRTDLLHVHLVDPAALARALSRCERTAGAW